MSKLELLNTYECTFISDKGTRKFNVAAPSFGRAAWLANLHNAEFEDAEAYELIKLQLSNLIFVENA